MTAAAAAAAAGAAAGGPALETMQRRVAWPLRKDDYAQVENWIDPARFLESKLFGGELLVFSLCVRLVFFGVVLLKFLLYCVALFSESWLKHSLLVRCAFWKAISGANFWFFAFVSS